MADAERNRSGGRSPETFNDYDTRLHRLVDRIYKESIRQGFSLPALAEASGLCYRTVLRLSNYDTLFPRLRTVMALAYAVGMRVELVASGKPAGRKSA